MTAKELLRKAAALIAKHGFTKGIRLDWRGRMCVIGALDKAAGYDPGQFTFDGDKPREWKTAVRMIAKKVSGEGQNEWRVAFWNNAPERTQKEVVRTLRSIGKATA